MPKVKGRDTEGENEKHGGLSTVHLQKESHQDHPSYPLIFQNQAYHPRTSRSIPATEKAKPLQAARQNSILKPLTSKHDTYLYNHIWKQVLHSQEVTDECRAQRRWFWFILLLPLNRKVRPQFCAGLSLKPMMNILVNSIKIQPMFLGTPPHKYRGKKITFRIGSGQI